MTEGRWRRLALGAISLGLGLWLFIRPFTSLQLLTALIAAGLAVVGIARLTAPESAEGTPSRVLGMVWIAVAAAILVWPGLTVRALSYLVGVFLIVDGVADVWGGFKAGTDQKLAAVIKGVATVVFGVVALAWPDITLLVVALVFAARLIVFGGSRVISAFRSPEEVGASTRPRRWLNLIGAVLMLALAGTLALVSSRLNDARPVVDAFYTAPSDLPSEPGELVRIEPFERGIPPEARAWRILYTTTRDEGRPAVASGIVVAPTGPPEGPRPVIAWAHGTTGVAQACAPSILEGTFATGAFFSLDTVIDQDWVLVATDYVGLGTVGPHPYLIGQGVGRSVLDAVRAAHAIDGLDLDERTVAWGHSQGGHAALWTGVLAPSYAPDVNLIGVAALAPVTDILALVDALPDFTGGSIFAAFVASAYADVYPDVSLDNYVIPGGEVTVRGIAGRCLAEPAVFTSLLSALTMDFSIFRADLAGGALGERLAENTPPFAIEVPLLLAQGGADGLILPSMQDAYVSRLCAADRQVDYRTYDGLGHVPLVEADSPLIPDLIQWTQARLAGELPTSSCP